MNVLLILGTVLSWLLVGLGCWLAWHLLHQNGRLLLRLEALEQRLEEMEFGNAGESPESPIDSATPDDRAARFNSRSVARSRINRNGLTAGTLAPDFRLPRLDGGEFWLQAQRGHRVLLVFSDPHCDPCTALAPELEQFHREHSDIKVVMISRGEPKENRMKVNEHGLTFPVVLQKQWEISRLYGMFATPIAYLIDEAGAIMSEVAVGVEPILALMAARSESRPEPELILR